MPHMEILDDDSDQGIVGPFASGGLSIRGKISPPKRPGPNTTTIEEGYNLELVTGRPALPIFIAGPTIHGNHRKCGPTYTSKFTQRQLKI